MQDVLKNNIKLIIGIFIGILISTVSVYAAGELFASNITYDNTTSGLTSTNVQSALNELGEKVNNWIDPSYIDFTTLQTNYNETLLVSSAGICIKRNGKVSCMKINNWNVERDHIQQIFSDTNCVNENETEIYCIASDFQCNVNKEGWVYCKDENDSSNCIVNPDGSIECN